jgi:hypothetical protein
MAMIVKASRRIRLAELINFLLPVYVVRVSVEALGQAGRASRPPHTIVCTATLPIRSALYFIS